MWNRLVVLFFGMTLLLAAPANSEPISITDGWINGTPGQALTMSLEGTAFAYTGAGYDWTAVSPSLCAPCYAGSTVSFSQLITEGHQFLGGGTGTYQGTTFTIPWSPHGATLQLELSGTYTVPSILTATSPLGAPSYWTVTAPFSLSGIVDPVELAPIQLSGQGIMTLSASTNGFSTSEAFVLTTVRFDLSADVAPRPVPEPTTLGLVGFGLGLYAALRRWAIA
jgi:hypothetical protein